MRKLFSTILCFAVLAVACETGNEGGKGVLNITSKKDMIVEASGGNHEISYTLDGASDISNIVATSVEEWISDIVVDAAISFQVAENTSTDSRVAVIEINYGSQSFNVKIHQKGYVPPYGVEFKAEHFNASYYGKVGTTGFDYPVVLSDIGVPSPSNQYYGSKQYYLDLYSDVSNGFTTEPVALPEGIYEFDPSSSGRAGTFASQFSYYLEISDSGSGYDLNIIDGTVTVSEGRIEALLCMEDGQWHLVTYEGNLMTGYEYQAAVKPPYSLFAGDYDFNVKGGYIRCYYRGDFYGLGYDVWYISMIETKAGFSGLYMMFEVLVDKSRGGYKQNAYLGEYKACTTNEGELDSFIPGRLRDASVPVNSWALRCKDGMTQGDWGGPLNGGTITFEQDGGEYIVTFDCVDDAGNAVTGTFRGILGEHMNQCPELDVEDGDILPE